MSCKVTVTLKYNSSRWSTQGIATARVPHLVLTATGPKPVVFLSLLYQVLLGNFYINEFKVGYGTPNGGGGHLKLCPKL